MMPVPMADGPPRHDASAAYALHNDDQRVLPFQISSTLDARTKSSRLSALTLPYYCAGAHCSHVWTPAAIASAVTEFPLHRHGALRLLDAVLRCRATPRVKYFCQTCNENLTAREKEDATPSAEHPSVAAPSMSHQLRIYSATINLIQRYLVWLLLLVLSFPIMGLLLATPSVANAVCPTPLRKLWTIVPRIYVLYLCAYVYGVATGIAVSFAFIADVLLWAWLEATTVFLACIGILAVAAKRDDVGAPSTSEIDVGRGLVWVLFPQYKVHQLLHLLHVAPTPQLIAHASVAKYGYNLADAVVLDKRAHPICPNALPGVFMARQVKWPRMLLAIAVLALVGCNVVLVVAWTAGVLPGVPFVVPGLVNGADYVNYTVTGSMAPLCTSLNGSHHALWNLQLSPVPSAASGLYPLDLAFLDKNGSATSFFVTTAWGLPVQRQDNLSVQVGLVDGQGSWSFLGRFENTTSCNDVGALLPVVSVPDFVWLEADVVNDNRAGLAPFALLLLIKHLLQSTWLSVLTTSLALGVHRLWAQFDSMRLEPTSSFETGVVVECTVGTNLEAWFRVRQGVVAATSFYTALLDGFVLLASLQAAVAFGGLLCYCMLGTAPIPTYYVLLGALVGALPTLLALLPVALASSLRRRHLALLEKLQLEIAAAQHRAPESGLASLLGFLDRLVAVLARSEDRIDVAGVAISLRRLGAVGVLLVTGLAYVGCHPVNSIWAASNDFYFVYYGY
ncbi:hypothetical protein SDRG_14516 [Saprolegnia diclina VS20]|uniref:Uncharacterized protein n=1 Tax=Saprolegnia diclina (strain VS20) TaxID=1156394 RepID=T0RDJ9_SAPDV|nr:hypothetical protein SDRG_14516 [Saprolegnia diclina VS20]EQC27677.1 hypothetical protein SDRG_14516 [Saprolegnia diclina VS20]|eukprot:XP_008618872.1 hypothetical protein SDRG_14516 [Saprolegnia diclina VS20]